MEYEGSETTSSTCTREAAEETEVPAVFLPRSQHADGEGAYHSLHGTHYMCIPNSFFINLQVNFLLCH